VHERLHDGVFANAAWLQVPFGFSSACDLLSKNLLHLSIMVGFLLYIERLHGNSITLGTLGTLGTWLTASLLQLFLGSMTAT
jgi:hypothetical protein